MTGFYSILDKEYFRRFMVAGDFRNNVKLV